MGDDDLTRLAAIRSRALETAEYFPGWTPLHEAANDGDVGAVKALISENVDIAAVDDRGYTAAHVAAHRGTLEVLKALGEGGAPLNLKSVEGKTPRAVALECGHQSLASFLENVVPSGVSEDVARPTSEVGACRSCGEPLRPILLPSGYAGTAVCVNCAPPAGVCPNCSKALRSERSEHCRACHASWLRPSASLESSSEELKAELRRILDHIVGEEPICYTLVHGEIEERVDDDGGLNKEVLLKLPDLAAAALVGGPLGEMAFGGILGQRRRRPAKFTYKGKLGLLAVCHNRVVVGQVPSPFMDKDGTIHPVQLQVILAYIDLGKVSRREFVLDETQVILSGAKLKLRCGDERFACSRSELNVMGAPYGLPSLQEVAVAIREAGARPRPMEFADSLRRGECPVGEQQLQKIGRDRAYSASIIRAISRHRMRKEIVEQVQALPLGLQELIHVYMKKRAQFMASQIVALVVLCGVLVGGLLLLSESDMETQAAAAALALASLVAIPLLGLSLLRTIWCRRTSGLLERSNDSVVAK